MSVAELAARTPAGRDRYVDFLRAFSIAAVVFGHWLVGVIWRSDGRLGVHSAVGLTSGLWLATWVLQVMPLFFFVGGFSNLLTWRRGTGYADFARTRLRRLLPPVAAFCAAWLPVQVALHLLDAGGDRLFRLSKLPIGPLWFLVVYVAVVLATPLMVRLHEAYGAAVPVVLALLVAAGDVLRFGLDVPLAGWANLLTAWLFAHQLGFAYAGGSLGRAVRWLAAGGLAGLVVLTNLGVYPRSMVGTDVEAVSNMNPPTLCVVALACWQVGVAMLLRPRVARWLERPRAWTAVVAANGMVMTVYLWHLTAYVLAVLLLWPLGLGRESDTTAAWWLQRPVWVLVPAVLLAGLVAGFGRFERGVSRARVRTRVR